MTYNTFTTTAKTTKGKGKNNRSNVVSSFIRKSYQLLEDQKYTDIVDWNEEGTAIVIKQPVEFGQDVLPTYFKHNNLTSFVRQLNMYDFRKRRSQDYDHVYYHDLFQHGKESQLILIKRKTQDSSLVNVQKALESLKNISDRQHADQTAEICETQLLKKLNKDAMHKIDVLENKINELSVSNHALRNELNHQNKKEDMLVAFVSEFLRKKDISFDTLNEEFSGQFKQLQGDVLSQSRSPSSDFMSFSPNESKLNSLMDIDDSFGLNGNQSVSTEVPCWSPQSRAQADLNLMNLQDESENWKYQSEPLVDMEQFGKRSFGLRDDEFEALTKAVKTDMNSGTQDLVTFPMVNTNLSYQEEKVEDANDIMSAFADPDAFLNYEPSLISFN